MKLKELAERYYFHDSLIEKILYDKIQNEVILEIDFCNWQQSGYNDDLPETEIIRLVFSEAELKYEYFELNSDSIILCEFVVEEKAGVKFIVFNDLLQSAKEIIVFADSVDFCTNSAYISKIN